MNVHHDEGSFLPQEVKARVPELYKRVKVNSLPRGTAHLKGAFFPLLNAIEYYAKLLLEEASNKINQLFPSNGISFKNTMAMSWRGRGPSESKFAISKTTGREGSLGCYILN